jgi:polar amino acid transport system substrate-binding protein
VTDFNIDDVRQEIAPSGTLVCALNHGNVVLVRRGPTDETPTGVSVDIARKLAAELSVPVRFRHFDKAGDVSGSAGTSEWDVCFLAIDPKRAERIAYSSPYVQIEGAFLVPKLKALSTFADVDRSELKIGAVKGSAYELFLSRNHVAGTLVRFDSFPDAMTALDHKEVDGLAGVRQAMQKVVADRPDFQVMAEPFMAIPQAVGVSAHRPLAAKYVAQFVQTLKSNGFVRKSLDDSGHADVVVPA